MICYKGKTFCQFWKSCKYGQNCNDALTEKVKQDADKWMNRKLICQYAEKPECFVRSGLK